MTIRRVHVIITSGGPSLYYRILLPLRHLNPMRYHVTWTCPDAKDLKPGDIILVQNIPDSSFWAEACVMADVLTVYDLAGPLPFSVAQASALARADLVTVATPAMGKVLDGIRPTVEVIPSCLSVDWVANVRFNARDEVYVGWAGADLREADWQGLGLKLKTFSRREGRARFRAIGHDPFAPHVSASKRPWQPNSDARWNDLEFDIGLAPLSDSHDNRLTDWVQVMEYSAKGIVPVASPVGQAVDWIEHGVNGFLAESPDQWLESLLKLSDDQFREKVSCAAMSRAEEWTVDKMIFMWESAYERCS